MVTLRSARGRIAALADSLQPGQKLGDTIVVLNGPRHFLMDSASAQTGAGADTAHGGKVAPQESLSKHHADLTGGMQGTGQPAPLGPGGVQ